MSDIEDIDSDNEEEVEDEEENETVESQPRVKRTKFEKDEESFKLNEVLCPETQVPKISQICALCKNWMFYMIYFTLLDAVISSETRTSDDIFLKWWKLEVSTLLSVNMNEAEIEAGVDKNIGDLMVLVKAAEKSYRGPSQTFRMEQKIEEKVLCCVKMACRRAYLALYGYKKTEIPGLTFSQSHEKLYSEAGPKKIVCTVLTEGWDVKVIDEEEKEKIPAEDRYAVFIEETHYLNWKKCSSHSYLVAAVHIILNNLFSTFSFLHINSSSQKEEPKTPIPSELSCPPKEKWEQPNFLGIIQEKKKELPMTILRPQNQSGEDLDLFIQNMNKKIQELEPLADVTFILCKDEYGEYIDETKKEKRPRVKGHMIFFASASERFRKLAQTDLREGKKKLESSSLISGGTLCIQPDIDMENLNLHLFQSLQMWVYGNSSQAAIKIAGKHVAELAEVSHVLLFPDLHKACIEHIRVKEVNLSSVIGVLYYAEDSVKRCEMEMSDIGLFQNLANDCYEFLVTNFKGMVKGKVPTQETFETLFQIGDIGSSLEWLSPSQFLKIVPLVYDKFLLNAMCHTHSRYYPGTGDSCPTKRIDVYILVAILRWCLIVEERLVYLPQLLNYVNFELFCPRFLIRQLGYLDFTKSCYYSQSEDLTRSAKDHKHFNTFYSFQKTKEILSFKQTEEIPELPYTITPELLNNLIRIKVKKAQEVQLTLRRAKDIKVRKVLKTVSLCWGGFLLTRSIHENCECGTAFKLTCKSQEKEQVVFNCRAKSNDEIPSLSPCCLLRNLYSYIT